MPDRYAAEGARFPLGATWVEEAAARDFALYSQDAEGGTLPLYAEADPVNPVFAYRLDHFRNKSGRVWHCRVPGTSSAAPATTPTPWPAPTRKTARCGG